MNQAIKIKIDKLKFNSIKKSKEKRHKTKDNQNLQRKKFACSTLGGINTPHISRIAVEYR